MNEILESIMGRLSDWTALDTFLIDYLVDPQERPGVIASSFAATLEMVRYRFGEVHQGKG